MASLGHSGSHTSQLMHSSVMNRDILNLFVWFEMGLDYSGFFIFRLLLQCVLRFENGYYVYFNQWVEYV